MPKEWIFYAVLIGINLIGFLLMGIDKKRARQKQWRIKESYLWMVAIFGGAVGSFLGMIFFHHKTKHLSFKIGFPLFAILQIAIYAYVYQILLK